MTVHKASLTVTTCFDATWLNGFCFGAMTTRKDVIAVCKHAIEVACKEATACRFKVRSTTSQTWPRNHWAVWVDYPDVMERRRETESPYVMPCVNCVLDRSETPYCQNLCGPAPYVGLAEILEREGM